MPAPHEPNCRHCDRPLVEAETVRLWDGRDYCRDCVEAEMPGLAEYAASHPTLEEAVPNEVARSGWRVLSRRFLYLFTFVILIFGVTPALYDGLTEGQPYAPILESASRGVLFSGGIALLVFVPMAIALMRSPRSQMVVAEHGILRCLTMNKDGVWQEDSHRAAPVDAVQWLVGRGPPVAADRKVVAVIFPNGRKWKAAALCGWSPEMRRRWVAFLTLAGAHCLRPIPADRG
ncbi:MAG: hypothetical protein WD066_08735 [Planctomycetaceae bacterium]